MWEVSWGVLERLKTGKSALVGALVGGHVGPLVGPLVGRGSLSPVLCVVHLMTRVLDKILALMVQDFIQGLEEGS